MVIQSFVHSMYGMNQNQIGDRIKVLVIGIIIFHTASRDCLYNLDSSVCTVQCEYGNVEM